ncbi:hypothetical protein PILCRDRAFT_828697 [Piloderma croceum F 1598]|uniref:F-box domain-containing protein n=1 Tax=Piloderma croceum (strain F 1598) TaxID=765440 RepID=A0A0C3F130_PILCF|nr:hypothetical protein PILCRDRAFT_828697 [Piloderma croceum F 1598]
MVRLDLVTDIGAIDVSSLELPNGGPRLPTDLWPDIISHLSFESLESVMFVCHYFRTLAQPFFFRTLAIKPFALYLSWTRQRNEDDCNWIKQKLEFYSSPTIARHVQICRITPYRPSGINSAFGTDRGRSTIDPIFKLLPQLTNLTEIDLDTVHLTEDNMKQMSRIPRLNTVFVKNCIVMALPIRLAAKTVFLRLKRCRSFHPSQPNALLLSLLQPDVVESLCMTGDPVAADFDDIARLPSLQCLHTLCINYSTALLASFLPCLTQLPVLREIILRVHSTYSPALQSSFLLPPSAIPLLEKYGGPLELAGYFGQGRPLKHLKLCGVHTGDNLLKHLSALNSDADIEALEFHVVDVNKSLLDGLFDTRLGFPSIKALDITFDSMDHKLLTCVLPTMRLPLDIEYLSIVQSDQSSDHAVPADELVLKKAYLTQYSALRYVAFTGNGYSWRFDPSTGAPAKGSRTMEDWQRPTLSQAMIERISKDD